MRKYLLIWTVTIAAILALTGCDILKAIDKELDSSSDASTRNSRRGADANLDNEPDTPVLSDTLQKGITTLSARAEQVWNELPSAEIPDDVYICEPPYPMSYGGMLTFFCHISNTTSYADIQDALGIQVFLSGPHHNGTLDLNAYRSFGYYNPEFVKTLTLWTLPAAKSETFRKATQHAYEKGPQVTARTYWAVYQKLKAHPTYWKSLQPLLFEAIESEEGPNGFYWDYEYFMNPHFLDGDVEREDFSRSEHGGAGGYYDGSVVGSAVGFWLRRDIDGTAEHFANALEQLLTLYDANFLAQTDFDSPTIKLDEN